MNQAATIEERYCSATSSSNLRCETREDAPTGDVGVMIAAGWSDSRIGTALMRMHTKADRETLSHLHANISRQAVSYGIERPAAVAASVLSWWLSHVCKSCNGVKFELITGIPALSNRHCKPCKGSGEVAIPHGEAGKRLAAWLDCCHERGAQSIQRRLRNTRK